MLVLRYKECYHVRQLVAGSGPAILCQGAKLYVLPAVRDIHELTATFQLPCLFNRYHCKADEYIEHLVGHEGPGSLLSLLKRRGWATELSAGVGEGGYDRSTVGFLFDVTVTLTEEGLHAAPGTWMLACV